MGWLFRKIRLLSCKRYIWTGIVRCTFDKDKLAVTFLNSVAETAVKKTKDPRKGLEGRMG
jgi:hypothetical protein